MKKPDENDRARAGNLSRDPLEGMKPVSANGNGEAPDGDGEEDPPDERFEPFPVDTLPEPLRRFVSEAAAAIGCDPSYVALPLLAAVAAAIGNTRRIRLKASWTEPSVIWSATVGESGSLKSPPFDAALGPLRRWQSRAFTNHREEMKRHETALARHEEAVRAWRKGGSKGTAPEKPSMPRPLRIRVSDPTVEALAAIFEHSPRGLLLERDELAGWIASFDAYKSKSKGSDAPHYLEMHRAGPVTVDRKGGEGPVHVAHAALSVTGTIQPRTLARVLGEDRFEDGFAARLLLAMPPSRKKKWTENDISTAASDALAGVFEGLLALDFESHSEEGPQPVIVTLSPEAKAEWIAFYDSHAEESAGLSGDEAALWAKVEGYVPRFALIFHTVRRVFEGGTGTEVEAAEIRNAATLARWFAAEARRIYAILRESDGDRDRRRLLELIHRKGGRITARELRISDRRFRKNPEGAKEALEDLVSAKLGKMVRTEGPGRPTDYFELEPVNETTKPPAPSPTPFPRGKATSGGSSEIRRFVDAPHSKNGTGEREPREEGWV